MWNKTKHGVDISQTQGMKEPSRENLWIVAADRSQAKIFQYNKNGVALVEQINHPEGRFKDRELTSDHPGRVFNSRTRSSGGHQGAAPRHSFSAEESPKDHLTDKFAKAIAALLEKARIEKRFDHFLLIAESQLMGTLKVELSASTERLIQGEFEKDYSWLTQPELEKRLSLLLPRLIAKKNRFLPKPQGTHFSRKEAK